MQLFLDNVLYEKLKHLIINDPDYITYLEQHYEGYIIKGEHDRFDIDTNPLNWPTFIKQKYKIKYSINNNSFSPYYYGSLYGTKSRMNMFLLRL